jgi:large subunit ribosomal protein L3
MVKALIGKKLGMTQVFDESGDFVPVTVLQVGPCVVTQVKSRQKDNTEAVQLGFEDRKAKRVGAALGGHFAKAGVRPKRVVRDVQAEGEGKLEVGQELRVDLFEGVDYVDVTGISKGRGFAGVVKRYGFSGAPKTHGGRFGRRTGSIGASTAPGRVVKGKGMAGQMGARRVTVRNLRVVGLDPARDIMLVRGAVAGSRGNYLLVRKAVLPPGGRSAARA